MIELANHHKLVNHNKTKEGSYGRGILFSRYKLDESECRQLGVEKKIKPPRRSIYSHIHHIDHSNGITAIDYK